MLNASPSFSYFLSVEEVNLALADVKVGKVPGFERIHPRVSALSW